MKETTTKESSKSLFDDLSEMMKGRDTVETPLHPSAGLEQNKPLLMFEIDEPRFVYNLTNNKCTISEMKVIVNGLMKSLSEDEAIMFNFNVINDFDLSKHDSTVGEMKSLVTTMMKMLDKDEQSKEVSFKLVVKAI